MTFALPSLPMWETVGEGVFGIRCGALLHCSCQKFCPICNRNAVGPYPESRSGAGFDPGPKPWIPASAGMTGTNRLQPDEKFVNRSTRGKEGLHSQEQTPDTFRASVTYVHTVHILHGSALPSCLSSLGKGKIKRRSLSGL
jgi:hypothetical protein